MESVVKTISYIALLQILQTDLKSGLLLAASKEKHLKQQPWPLVSLVLI